MRPQPNHSNNLPQTVATVSSGLAAAGDGAGLSLNLSAIPEVLRGHALEAWQERDASGIMCMVDHYKRFDLLLQNMDAFRQVGIYEQALVDTFTHGPYLHPDMWRFAFNFADRSRLASCGESIPTEPVKVYRGVNDKRRRKFIRGLSWTTDPHIAAWFALRFGDAGNGAVYETTLHPDRILFITDDRKEREIVADVQGLKIKRMDRIPEPIKGGVR